MASTTIQLHANELKAAARFAYRGLNRDAIASVLVEPDGTLVATNGETLIATAEIKEPEGAGSNIPLAAVEAIIAAAAAVEEHANRLTWLGGDEGPPPAIVNLTVPDDGGDLAVSVGPAKIAFASGPAYPDWRKVIPSRDIVLTIGFQTALLRRALKAAEDLGAGTVAIDFRGPHTGAVIRPLGVAPATILVMPVRLTEPATTPTTEPGGR